MEENDNNRIKTFNYFGNPESIGLRWKWWLFGFELFADGKGLIVAANYCPTISKLLFNCK